MKKKIILIAICAALIVTTVGIAVGAAVASSTADVTSDDIRFIRGYAGEKGEWSLSGKKINLNGSGVASTAQSIVWNPEEISGEAGVEFIVTYNEDYTNVGDSYGDYRFAVALMDSQHFQGEDTGHGLGVDYRLADATGTIRGMGFYYDGANALDLKYPNRNATLNNVNNSGVIVTATENRSVKCKITYNGGWKIWIDSNDDDKIDALVAGFDPADSWEVNNNNIGQYFPTNLFSGGKAYLVFGSYNANKMNMSIQITSVYGGFSLQEETYADNTVTRVGESIALEDSIRTNFYVQYSNYDAYAKARVNMTCGDETVALDSSDGVAVSGQTLTYAYSMPVPAALADEDIEIQISAPEDSSATYTGDTVYSTSVTKYLTALKQSITGNTDKDNALTELIDAIGGYTAKAKAYFDLVG